MEVQPEYPIETFDPLLRDLVGWGLVERQDATAWRLVASAQRRLDELLPTRAPGSGAVVFLNRRCADCQKRGLTRLRGESYVCDGCWAERQVKRDVDVSEPASPAEQTHFWRRSRQRQTTTLAS
jgi:hypothetical protein